MNRYTKDFRWIHTRTDLILFAQAHCELSACTRAFLTGKVMVLGGFSSIPPSTNPGWIFLVTSIHKRTWIISVEADDIQHRYHVRILDKIPWAKWLGKPPYAICKSQWSLRNGDIPHPASWARRLAQEKADGR